MTALDILMRCREYPRQKEQLTERMTRYRDAAARIGIVVPEDGGSVETGSSLINGIAEVNAQIAQRDREYKAEVEAACMLLDTLPQTACAHGYRYYILCGTTDGIAAALHYSPGYSKNVLRVVRARMEQIGEDELRKLLPEWYLEGRQ